MPDKTCPHCGRRFALDVHFCQDDGTPLTLATGTLLAGRYEIVRELGRGAMGVVYLALERELGARPCAIKILRVPPGHTEQAAAESLARLKSEAMVLGSLGSHPNLVTVYTAGQDEYGLTYIVMEYVEGESLKEKFARGTPFNPLQAARIVRQIADGLQHAHAQGVVHRDLKPGNLILTASPDSPSWVKIVDFGIAKVVQGPSDDLTRTGSVIGTPRYMSPEQRAGSSLDHRSDIFSLALIAAELLSGDPYGFDEEPGVASETTADWPDDLQRVIAGGLAQDPAGRPSSAVGFARAIEDAVHRWEGADGIATSVAPSDELGRSSADDDPRSSRVRRRWWASGGAAAAVAGVAWVWSGASPFQPSGIEMERLPDSTITADTPTAVTPSSGTDPADGDGDPSLTERDEAPAMETAASDRREPQPVTGAPTVAGAPAVVERSPGPALEALRAQVDPDRADTTGLAAAVVEATSLLNSPGIADSVRTEIRYLRAEASLLAGEVSAACRDLETIRSTAEEDAWTAGRYARAVTVLLDLHCGETGAS